MGEASHLESQQLRCNGTMQLDNKVTFESDKNTTDFFSPLIKCKLQTLKSPFFLFFFDFFVALRQTEKYIGDIFVPRGAVPT